MICRLEQIWRWRIWEFVGRVIFRFTSSGWCRKARREKREGTGTMASMTNLVYYASVSRGCTVVAEHKKAKEDLADVAVECLEKVPAFHNQFTYTMKQRMFLFLMEGGFTYCAIVDEALGKVKGFGFLEQVKEEFKLLLRSRGLDGSRLERNALTIDFAGVFRHLAKPFVGVPQKEVDLNDEHHSDSKDDTVLSPSPSQAEHSHAGGMNVEDPAPLTLNGYHKVDKKSTKQQQVLVQFHLLGLDWLILF